MAEPENAAAGIQIQQNAQFEVWIPIAEKELGEINNVEKGDNKVGCKTKIEELVLAKLWRMHTCRHHWRRGWF